MKVIESRLNDTKRQKIAIGDEIIFSEQGNALNTVMTRVRQLFRHTTFKELFAKNDPLLFGNVDREVLLNQVRKIYTIDDEAKYGVVGIQFELIT